MPNVGPGGPTAHPFPFSEPPSSPQGPPPPPGGGAPVGGTPGPPPTGRIPPGGPPGGGPPGGPPEPPEPPPPSPGGPPEGGPLAGGVSAGGSLGGDRTPEGGISPWPVEFSPDLSMSIATYPNRKVRKTWCKAKALGRQGNSAKRFEVHSHIGSPREAAMACAASL